MKLFRLSAALLVVSTVGFMGLSTFCPVHAEETPGIESMKTPEEIQAFRLAYIENFHRTGLNTTLGDARFLRILVASAGSKRGIEVGSASGFGAINMGMAFERNGGKLITVDIDARMVALTREHIRKMGLEKSVEAVEGDALKVLPALQGEFDFIFIDALKQDYLKYYKAVEAKMKPGSLIVADNVIQSADAMQDFLSYMEKSPDYDMQIVRSSMDKNDGMAVIYKLK